MKKLLCISLILVFFASCSGEPHVCNDMNEPGNLIELSEHEFASIAFDSPKDLTEDLAMGILINFIESEQQVSPTRVGLLPSISLIEKKVLTTKNTIFFTRSSADDSKIIQSSIYKFKISDGINEGFALVSGDERSPALIAYVPNFNENTYAISGAQIMLEHAQASHLSDIVFIENLKDSLRAKTYAKISAELNIPIENLSYEFIKGKIQIIGEGKTRVNPVTNPPTRIYSFVFPLITTKWDQGNPYNSTHPNIVLNKNTGATGKPFAGCVPVAIAQIFAYCEVSSFKAQGTTVNWQTLKATREILVTDPLATRNMVGNLMLEIFYKVNASYDYNEVGVHNGTEAVYTKYVPYIQGIISAGSHQAYNWTVVQNSLTALQPVIIRGQGHCWILDGYAVCQKSGSTGTSQYDTYVTTNFGWGGSWDGYYKLNDNYSADFHGDFQTTELFIVPNCKKK